MDHRPKVLIESPFAGSTPEEEERNIRYVRACMRDSFINHGELPFASHAIYPLKGILNDKDPEERKLGMAAGFAYGADTEYSVFYVNYGVSSGMMDGAENAELNDRPIKIRKLPDNWDTGS